MLILRCAVIGELHVLVFIDASNSSCNMFWEDVFYKHQAVVKPMLFFQKFTNCDLNKISLVCELNFSEFRIHDTFSFLLEEKLVWLWAWKLKTMNVSHCENIENDPNPFLMIQYDCNFLPSIFSMSHCYAINVGKSVSILT